MNRHDVMRRVQTALLRAVLESPTGLASMDDAWALGLIPNGIRPPQWIGSAVSGLVARRLIVERDVEKSRRESRHRSKQGVYSAADRVVLRRLLNEWRADSPNRMTQRCLFDGEGDGV